jgi:hypothetical protein
MQEGFSGSSFPMAAPSTRSQSSFEKRSAIIAFALSFSDAKGALRLGKMRMKAQKSIFVWQ